ncbi:MAG: hypothetical protein HYV09_34545 [Deltaproteobacteria bacterium]|nr:hypothetical protein [Deltaproteobacteria bacterium]
MRAWLLAPVLVHVVLVGCSAAQRPRACRGSAACAEGDACVAGTCIAATSTAPATAAMRRLTVEPEAIAFVLSDEDEPSLRPAVAPLGASVGPRARILVKFAKPDLKESVARAWLVLDRAEGAQAGPGDVTVRVEHIVEPWSVKGAAGTTWATAPRAESIVGAEVLVAARGSGPIRIDVTPWLVDYTKKGARSWGLRVEGTGNGFGVPIATGMAKGTPPRLEIYLQ